MAGEKGSIPGTYIFPMITDQSRIKRSIKRVEELSIHIETISRIGDAFGWDSNEMKVAQEMYARWQAVQTDPAIYIEKEDTA